MSVECELELVNLVEVSQDKLVKNFTILLSRLAKHEEMLVQHK